MRSMFSIGAGVLLTACTQPAAMVEDKGGMFFAKEGVSAQHYANIAPAAGSARSYSPPPRVISYGTTTSPDTAPLTSVSTKDLGPPAPSEIKHAPSDISSRNIWEKPTSSASPTTYFIAPVQGKITSTYGKRTNGMGNDGITYSAPLGEPVYASQGGEVAYVGNELKSYGNMVIIKHAHNFNTTYANLGRSVVSKDSKVKQGQIIGYVGQSGDAPAPQLHFAMRKGTATVNPQEYLSNTIASKF